jgi:cbb3-type cytochrome oxidase cytochrome c subunit
MVAALVVLDETAAASAMAGPLKPEGLALRPGLIAEYRSAGGKGHPASLVRIDPKPAFTWGDSSPHPRIPPGPFEVTWTGILDLREPHAVHFGAYVAGEVSVTIDGITVLQGRGRKPTDWVKARAPFARAPGLYQVRIRYRSLAGVPARVQLWWEGKSFAREPLPASRLKHIPKELPETARAEELAMRGRDAVGRLGCARCHADALPAVRDAPPGPSLADAGQRIQQAWLVEWLANPAKVGPGARMPALFPADRRGFVERALVAEYLLRETAAGKKPPDEKPGDHRAGRQAFLGLGCVACHDDPEKPARIADPERYPLTGLGDRMPAAHLTAFLQDSTTRYPDGRMPKLPVPAKTARDITTYLLLGSKPGDRRPAPEPVKEDEVQRTLRRLGVKDRHAAGAALVREKGCARCHAGIGETEPTSIAIRHPVKDDGPTGCLSGTAPAPRFALDAAMRKGIAAYLKVAGREKHPSPFAARQRALEHFRCHRCHQRDGEEPAPLEAIGRTLWTPHLYRLPFQRTPRLTHATTRLRRDYLLSAVRDGVTGVRADWYSYRMPAFRDHAGTIVRALAEGDGDLPDAKDVPPAGNPDPTLTALGPALAGFEGYSCVSCHIWNGKSLAAVEPGTVGPELTSLTTRIRRDWFDRFLDDPPRLHPGTPMPSIFRRGEPAPLRSVLDGDATRQKDALWAYLAQGKKAESPRPRPPIAIPLPPGEPPLVAQIPVQLPDMSVIESISILYRNHDAIVYDVGRAALHDVYTGASLLRQANVWRSYQLAGTALLTSSARKADAITLVGRSGAEPPSATVFLGYDRLSDGVRLRWRWEFGFVTVVAQETLRIRAGGTRRLVRQLHLSGVPARSAVELRLRVPQARKATRVEASVGTADGSVNDGILLARFTPNPTTGLAVGTISFDLPAEQKPDRPKGPALLVKPDDGHIGPLERPGYRAILYPRPKTASGEDLVMPSALATHPRDGRLFVASMKLGDLFVLRDPRGDGKAARFDSYARGLFQDVFGMVHDGADLYVLHRRNLSRLRDADSDGRAERVDRLTALPHAVGNAYDWGYGLVRDRAGNLLFTFAPHASHHLRGSGSLLRLSPRDSWGRREEIAFGFRNPLGWCLGPDGEVFFTDNQGEWVATNKLCHVVPGHFYGYPNHAQRQHANRPMAPTAVWVPYAWARSINGVAHDTSGGKFGPFAGQLFLAELMHGGALLRASVEKVNGVYQGACFPFWGKGLLGPLTLAFDHKGRLFVGSVTTPGWMGQPDRGALFRIDFTGATPFEIQSIHARPHGFRLVFTRPVDAKSARRADSYQIEHYRYEYTGAYGSPEHDRTRLVVRRAELHADGRTVDLTTDPLVKGRVYAITAARVPSAKGEPPVHATGAYTLNEVPGR